MIVFNLLLISANSASTTDCYFSSPMLWELHGSYQVNQSNLYFTNNNETQSYIEYTSRRNRKKWMLSLCGKFEDSFLNFSSINDNNDFDNIDNISIEIQRASDKSIFNYLNVKLIKNENILMENNIKYSNKENTCFNVIYGRGYFGMFNTKDAHMQEGEQIFTSQVEIPRKHIFKYYSRKPSNVTHLCIGDFFGNKRLSIKPENDHWDPHIRDFL